MVLTLLSLSGMLVAIIGAEPPPEELPLPLLTLWRSSDGEMGPGELSTFEEINKINAESCFGGY